MNRPDTNTIVVDDPETPSLPHGCIDLDALESLARAIDRIDRYHFESGGMICDRPCLRRLESANGIVTAHISVGPAIGGSWEKLEYARGKWVHR